jgi:elongation factor P--(R)-beta-lysine ligase
LLCERSVAAEPQPAGDGVSAEVLAPDQLLWDPGLQGRSVRVGGRLIADAGNWRLANAVASIALELSDADGPRHEAIAVVEGSWDGTSLVSARLSYVAPSGAPAREWRRLNGDGAASRLALRARLLGEVRRYFDRRGFLEVDTPLRSAECGTEVHVEPLTSGKHYLITSPELHMKRLLVGGVHKLYQLVHCFRAGELGPRHSPEFLMLEWYRAFASYPALIADTERLIQALHRSVAESDELTLPSGARVNLGLPFLRLSVREAFTRFAGVADAAALAAQDEDEYFQLLVDRVEPAIAEQGQPVFLYDYPASQAALARLCPNDPSVAERFELYVGDVELCNGYGELTDPVEQRARCEFDRARRQHLGRHVPRVPERFLGALLEGMPPASGNALGMDRLLMLLGGEQRIDRMTPFPSEEA